jgi:prepilin-type N-terminal cleavage/methylation domain-containing protein
MKPGRTNRQGMTAIEVLATMVLASLMLASVTGLLGALARQARELRTKSNVPPWRPQLIDALMWDLQNSRRFIAARDGVRLDGFAARDFATGAPNARSALIEYFLIDAADDRWLMRRETHSDEIGSGRSRTEIVCRGIHHMRWGKVVVDEAAKPEIGPMIAPTAPWMVMPESIGIQLYDSQSAVPVIDQVLHLR